MQICLGVRQYLVDLIEGIVHGVRVVVFVRGPAHRQQRVQMEALLRQRRGERVAQLAGGRQQPRAENLELPLLVDEPELPTEPPEVRDFDPVLLRHLEVETAKSFSLGRESGVVDERQMTEIFVEQIRNRREVQLVRAADVAGHRKSAVAQVVEPDRVGKVLVLGADQGPAAQLTQAIAHHANVGNPRVIQTDALHAREKLGRGGVFHQEMLTRAKLVPGMMVFRVVVELVLVVVEHRSVPRNFIYRMPSRGRMVISSIEPCSEALSAASTASATSDATSILARSSPRS